MTNIAIQGLGDLAFGKFRNPSWVAKILAFDKKYKYKRDFLKHNIDYSSSSSTGNRGVFAYYILESGFLYEIKEQVSWKRFDRYFSVVSEDGEVKRITEQEAIEWLKNI